MSGPDLLAGSVMEEGVTERTVYLPKGSVWKDAYTKKAYEGGRLVTVPAPISVIRYYADGKEYDIYR